MRIKVIVSFQLVTLDTIFLVISHNYYNIIIQRVYEKHRNTLTACRYQLVEQH